MKYVDDTITPEAQCVARIFEYHGGYYVCSDYLDYFDTRGPVFRTKLAAHHAAALAGYTHYIGSGTYGEGAQKLKPYRVK